MSYSKLRIEDRATSYFSLAQGMSIRQIAKIMECYFSTSTSSREIKRNKELVRCHFERVTGFGTKPFVLETGGNRLAIHRQTVVDEVQYQSGRA